MKKVLIIIASVILVLIIGGFTTAKALEKKE